MKRFFATTCIFVLVGISPAPAQRPKLFRFIIYTDTGQRVDGILYDVTDSTVRYVPNRAEPIRQLRVGALPDVFAVHRDTIDQIVIRRKSQVVRGILTGGVIGGLSLLPLAASGNSVSGLETLGHIALATVGSVTGILYGTIRSIVPYRVHWIRRNADTFKSAWPELRGRSFVQQRRQTHLRR